MNNNLRLGLAFVVLSAWALAAFGGRSFSGSQYIHMPPATSPLTITHPLTLACWVKLNTTASSQTLVTIGGSQSPNGDCWILHYFPSTVNRFSVGSRQYGTGFGVTATNFTLPSTNVWYHVLGVITSRTNRALYLNGIYQTTELTNLDPQGPPSRVGIGVRVDTSIPGPTPWYLDGELAHVGIWNVALTANEIAQLGGEGNPGKAVSPNKIRPLNLVFYAPLDGIATGHEWNVVGPFLLNSNTVPKSSFKLIR